MDYNHKIFCFTCKSYTKTIEPLLVKRFCHDKIRIFGVCYECLIGKTKHYSYNLPIQIYNIPIGELFISNVYYEDGSYCKILDLVENFINK